MNLPAPPGGVVWGSRGFLDLAVPGRRSLRHRAPRTAGRPGPRRTDTEAVPPPPPEEPVRGVPVTVRHPRTPPVGGGAQPVGPHGVTTRTVRRPARLRLFAGAPSAPLLQ
ncbi:hypothetical protein GCM10010420_45780 [Streptomyces glaucosporus]|uniref:Uncharacterized protein n=1 Tax=Streptomyces glaucosporus TaxID=284044 RepID=A0ABN3ISS3_9ACTN